MKHEAIDQKLTEHEQALVIEYVGLFPEVTWDCYFKGNVDELIVYGWFYHPDADRDYVGLVFQKGVLMHYANTAKSYEQTIIERITEPAIPRYVLEVASFNKVSDIFPTTSQESEVQS